MNPTAPFDSSMQLLSKVLDLRARNQQVIASNIANAETPGYSPATFHFEEELRSAVGKNAALTLAGSHPNHMPLGAMDINSIKGTITVQKDTTGIGDENGVSVDGEMMSLSENELLYEAAAQLLKKKLGMIKYAISGGQ